MSSIYRVRHRHTGDVILQSVAWSEGSLRGAYLGQRLTQDLRSADFRGVDLTDADLTGRDLSDADLTGANLTGARYDLFTIWPTGLDPIRVGAVLVSADLRGAKRAGADVSGLDLTGADFSGADFSGGRFVGTTLVRARFRGTNLCGADLTDAILTDVSIQSIRTDAETRWPAGFDPSQPPSTPEKPSPTTLEDLSRALKTLADPNRLRLVGILAQEELTVEELSAALSLTPATTSHHLNRLRELGFVVVRPEGTRRLCRLDSDALQLWLRDLPAELSRVAQGSVDDSTFEGKVLATYFQNNRLVQIPMRQKKLMVILGKLVREFEVVRQYTEREVSDILKRFHPDYATLRRNLVDYRFMARKDSLYWRLR